MSMRIRRVAATLVALAGVASIAGCASSAPAQPSRPPASRLASPTDPPEQSPTVPSRLARPTPAGCASLYARLQQVTAALSASSQLIATSQDKHQLSDRIAYQQGRLQQAAELMAQRPIPPSLVPADRAIVAALRSFTADFARARTPAARGDFAAAAAAMTDKPVVQRIVDASKTIEDACT